MNTLNFNDADLKANREGRLSDAQRKRLNDEVDRMSWQTKHGGLLFALNTFIVLLGGLAFIDARLRQQLLFMLSFKDLHSSLFLVFTVSIWLGLPVLWDWWIVRRYVQGHIYTIEGENVRVPGEMRKRSFKKMIRADHPGKAILVSMKLRKRIRIKVRQVKIRSARLQEMTFLFRAEKPGFYFKPGQRYRVYYLVYYLSTIPQPLSVEEIEPEKAKR
jgi:hypothetical protein